MKTYIGTRGPTGPYVQVLEPGGQLRELGRFTQVRHHATGFDWGGGGPESTQLALAICCDLLGIRPAMDVYSAFRADVVAGFGREWSLTEKDALKAVEAIRQRAKLVSA